MIKPAPEILILIPVHLPTSQHLIFEGLFERFLDYLKDLSFLKNVGIEVREVVYVLVGRIRGKWK